MLQQAAEPFRGRLLRGSLDYPRRYAWFDANDLRSPGDFSGQLPEPLTLVAR